MAMTMIKDYIPAERKEKTLMQMLLDAGYPESEMYHHYSDLYVFVTPITTRVIDKWCNEHGYEKSLHCPKFKDQITGKPMYDCAFQYAQH